MPEGPNYRLEQIRLRDHISQQEKAAQTCLTTIMEAIDRIEKAVANRQAHLKAMEDYKGKLASLEETHGSFSDDDVLKLADRFLNMEGSTNG